MNDIEKLALRIAKSKIPCDKCIYNGPGVMCLYPLLEQAKHTEIKDKPDT